MPGQIPWEIKREALSSFAHDSLASFMGPRGALGAAFGFELDAPTFLKFDNELDDIVKRVRGVHLKYVKYRKSEAPPPNEARRFKAYKAELQAAHEQLYKFTEKLKAYREKHGTSLNDYRREALDNAIGSLTVWRKDFSIRSFGEKLKISNSPNNLHSFLTDFAREKYADRDGHPVELVLKSRDVGRVPFERFTLRRALYNLVTDAYNHRPGRPIYVTMGNRGKEVGVHVTNEGPPLKPEEIKKIGHERFTRAWHDPLRGYGKMSTRLLTEAMGGRFEAGNSKIGPRLSIYLPVRGPERRQSISRKAVTAYGPKKPVLARKIAARKRVV